MTVRSEQLMDAHSAGRRILLVCLYIELIILLLDLLLNYFQLIESSSLQKIFNVAREQSLGTWFSVVQAAIAGIVLLGLYTLTRTGQGQTWGWLLLACFFLYVSADDAAKIHERVGGHFGRLAADGDSALWMEIARVFPSYSWQWVFAPFFAVAGFYIMIFLWRQLRETSLRLTVLAAFGCWALAVGIDFVEGYEGFFEAIAESLAVQQYTVSHPFLMLEEFLEMFGTTLFLSLFVHCFVQNLNRHLSSSQL